jgi:hypothetical protein
MKNKIKLGIGIAIGITLGIVIANWANKQMTPTEELTLVMNNQSDILWQNILYGTIGCVTMLGCVVMGWLIGRKYGNS